MRMVVMCPDGPVTGGVEALHQLVDSARRQGLDAAICYYPPGRTEVVPAYAHYDIAVVPRLENAYDVVAVVPETSPFALGVIDRTRKVLWWLSVDNFFVKQGWPVTAPADDPDFLRELCGPALGVVHATQSQYARSFLFERGVKSVMLTDYLSDAFVVRASELRAQPKKDLVLYNPKKGLAFTERLIAASESVLEWQPIQGLSADGVAELLGSAKLYVDFGEHPGRDRIPREAALSGCAVITGRRGAAGFAADVPIPERFRLDESSPTVIDDFVAVATDTIARFEDVTVEFDSYRDWIAAQRDAFDTELAGLWQRACAPQFKGAAVNRAKPKSQSKSKRKR